MTSNPAPSLDLCRILSRLGFRLLPPLLALLCSSCAGVIQSQYDPNRSHPDACDSKGKASLGHYYLPLPYIQVYAYQTRIGSVSNIHYSVRSVVVPDTEHPIFLRHDYSMLNEDRLRVTRSPEGLLEHVAYRRDPKYVDSAVALAKAALSVTAPVPFPLKGDDGFPEFSKLVFKQNFSLTALLETACKTNSGGKADCAFTLVGNHNLSITADALLDGGDKFNCSARCPIQPHRTDFLDGLYYRPLVPVRVTLTEKTPTGVTNTQSEILYCVDPRYVEFVRLPKPKVAPQSYDLTFSGGTLQEVSIARDSEIYTLAKAPLDVVGSFVSLPSGLFTVKVYHNGEETGGYGDKYRRSGGDKDPGRGSNPPPKE